MNKYIKTILIGAVAASFTSCDDYLDQQPEDKLIPENYFNSASNLSAYTLPFYGLFTTHSSYSYELGTFSADNGTDNQAGMNASNRWVPGEWRVGSGTENWNFSNIRQLNFFFQYAQPNYEAGTISGGDAAVNEAMGEAHFFRAYAYWQYYSAIGDFPIIDGVLPDDKEVLLEASVRQPRNKVARYILEDLAEAARLLPETSSKGKNGLNKDCANLFRSRVALFEGTWLKYHKGTALVPGGPGWPGDASLLGSFDIDSEINYFLGEAMTSSKAVADKFVNNLVENTDTPEGQNVGFAMLNPYYCMFCETNLNDFGEVLLYKSYALSQGQSTQIQAQFQKNGGGSGWTRGMVNSFLMRNGLPIYAANSGYDPAWENQGVTATLQGRDSRIQIFTKGDNSIISYGMDGGTPEQWREGWLMDGGDRTRAVTGFAIKKGQGYNYAEATGNLQSITASIIFRASEALLNYMEASYEKNGTVDGTADSYWKALRRRAKVDTDWNKTVAATIMSEEAKGDWGAYSRGALINPTLYNIRRERRNELMGEALRLNDVRRWAALDQMITTPYQIEGIKYWGTVYADPNSPLGLKDGNGNFVAAVVNVNSGEGTMSPQENSDYVRPYQITKLQNLVWDGYRFTRAHYLSPIGHEAFVNACVDKNDIGTSKIYQNPGWPTNANEGATNID